MIEPNQRRRYLGIAAILVVFAVLGALRLNPFCLLEPDSPDYLFTSRALATFQGYTEIDHPARATHAFRPPGLPLLLAPLSAVRPFDVVAAKVLGLATTLAALFFVALLGRRIGGELAGFAALALVATGPYTLLHATEVVSEMPYLAALLATLLLVLRDEPPPRTTQAVMAVLLALLPLLRTVGLVWIAALVVWSVLERSRRWLAPIVVALAVNAAWMLRNRLTDTVTYFSGMAHDLSELGFGGYLAKSFDAAGFYLGSWFAVLLPGVFPGAPLYERFLLEPAPGLGGLWGVGWFCGALATGLAVLGCLARRRDGGSVVLLYAAGYVLALLVYPPRHERLIWPLVPLVWIYAPAGLAALRSWLAARRGNAGPPVLTLAAAFTLLLLSWQLVAVNAVVGVNRDWRNTGQGPPGFHDLRVPPMYYADWRAAGEWLAANAPADARVLTRHSDLGFTSGLLQDSARFEEISPVALHRRIAGLRARFLALPATRFGWLAPSHLLAGSPVYRFEPVYEAGDVLLVEVLPNRAGDVPRTSPGLAGRLAACRAALDRMPERADLWRRLVQLLHEAGRDDEALAVVDGLDTAEGWVTRGRIHLDRDEGEAALDAYRRAARAPGGVALSGTIERGIANAERRRTLAGRPLDERVRDELDRTRTFAQSLLFESAWRSIERATRLAPASADVAFARAALSDRTGDLPAAEAQYAALARIGFPGAAEAGARLRLERTLLAGETAAGPDRWLTLAAARAGEGLIGRALVLLESAAARHPDAGEVRRRLDELEAFYRG